MLDFQSQLRCTVNHMMKNIKVCSVCSKGGGYSFYIKCTLVGVTSCRVRPFLLSLTLNYFNTE